MNEWVGYSYERANLPSSRGRYIWDPGFMGWVDYVGTAASIYPVCVCGERDMKVLRGFLGCVNGVQFGRLMSGW